MKSWYLVPAVIALVICGGIGYLIGSTVQPTKYVEAPGPVVTVSAPTRQDWETKRYTLAEFKERYLASAKNPWEEEAGKGDACIHGAKSNDLFVTVVEDHCNLNTEQILDNTTAAQSGQATQNGKTLWTVRGGNWAAFAENEYDLNWVAGIMGGRLYEVTGEGGDR